MSNKYSQKLFDSAKKSTTYAIKNASKQAIQKTAEATGGTAFKGITPQNRWEWNEIPKERYIFPEKKHKSLIN